MKRAVKAMCAVLAVFMLSGCAKSYKDIKVTGFSLVSISPRGLSGVDALVDVGIDNPSVGFEVFDLKCLVKMDGEPFVTLTSDQLVILGKTSKTYSIPLKGYLADGFNPFQLLGLLKDMDISRFKADVSARVNLRGGVGKEIKFKDLPLEGLINSNRKEL